MLKVILLKEEAAASPPKYVKKSKQLSEKDDEERTIHVNLLLAQSQKAANLKGAESELEDGGEEGLESVGASKLPGRSP